jgi:citrate lyase beta subunit
MYAVPRRVALGSVLAAVVLPKAESPAQLVEVNRLLADSVVRRHALVEAIIWAAAELDPTPTY